MDFTDSHCHLTYPRDDGLTPSDLVANAQAENVNTLLTIGTTHRSFAEMHAFTTEQEGVFCTYGIHPHYAGGELEPQALAQEIRKAAQLTKVVGLGESGLDYHYDNAPRDKQKESFRVHLELAQELDLPLVIHSRDAEEDTIALLEEALSRGVLQAVIHCFTSKKILADFAIKNGLYLGATGVITFKKSQELRDIFAEVPNNLLLIETDSPYLAPVPYRGKPNQPSYVPYVAECLAEARGQSLQEVAEITSANFLRLFPKVKEE
ncbi:MAG: TatD family hydrolase [Alphaproteobacteria bacterium]|nr:TatD family hydrolase [Alphaproteobacteria bacterium]MDD9920491.1 TatD family hydrolase [Alphaproteobacteria bacterium]